MCAFTTILTDAEYSIADWLTHRLSTRTVRVARTLSGTRNRYLPHLSILVMPRASHLPPTYCCSASSLPGSGGHVRPLTDAPVSVAYHGAGVLTTILRSWIGTVRFAEIASDVVSFAPMM